MAPVRYRTAEADGFKVFYREAGNGPRRSCYCYTVFRPRVICSAI
jgi:hypothetical protein